MSDATGSAKTPPFAGEEGLRAADCFAIEFTAEHPGDSRQLRGCRVAFRTVIHFVVLFGPRLAKDAYERTCGRERRAFAGRSCSPFGHDGPIPIQDGAETGWMSDATGSAKTPPFAGERGCGPAGGKGTAPKFPPQKQKARFICSSERNCSGPQPPGSGGPQFVPELGAHSAGCVPQPRTFKVRLYAPFSRLGIARTSLALPSVYRKGSIFLLAVPKGTAAGCSLPAAEARSSYPNLASTPQAASRRHRTFKVRLHAPFSRLGKARASSALPSVYRKGSNSCTFSRLGIARASLALPSAYRKGSVYFRLI